MTDSMNFGPDWIRNLSSEGTTGGGTGSSSVPRYQLADYRYGREEMLALFDKSLKPPLSLTNFKTLYSEPTQLPLAFLPNAEEEQRGWQGRPSSLGGPPRGRGGVMDRGGRISRGGRGGNYNSYNRTSTYDSGWGNGGEQPDWSPRKDYLRTNVSDNWRRNRNNDEDEGWRSSSSSNNRGLHEKWSRSTSWRGDGDSVDERNGPPERGGGRSSWHADINHRGAPPLTRRTTWDNTSDDHLPEWATENSPAEGGGTFDSSGAFHGSDDEQDRKSNKREPVGLQKSTSQQHITSKPIHAPLSSSKSAISLVKQEEHEKNSEDLSKNSFEEEIKENETFEREKPETSIPRKVDKDSFGIKENSDSIQQKICEHVQNDSGISNGPVETASAIKKSEEDFDRFQEDLVLKLVVDEEPPKAQSTNSFDVASVQPPPNLPIQDKWYYQDPQGQMQGPFHNVEMAEWYKAGYFSHHLKVRRHCDERFVLLGELITISGGDPFQSSYRFPPFKNETAPPIQPQPQEQDILQYQQLFSSLAIKQATAAATQARAMQEPWATPLQALQQQELTVAQRLQMLHQQQVSPDLSFIQQPTAQTNPLMMMINKMQQANKLPGHSVIDKPAANAHSLEPLLAQMGGLHALQSRMAPGGLPSGGLTPGGIPAAGITPTGLASGGLPPSATLGTGSLSSTSLPGHHLQSTLPNNLPGGMPPDNLTGLPTAPNMGSGGLPLSSLPSGLPLGLTNSLNVPRQKPLDQLQNASEPDPISNLLKQLQQQQNKQSQPLDSLWQQSQYPQPGPNSNIPSQQQWTQGQSGGEAPQHSMWDIQTSSIANHVPPGTQLSQQQTQHHHPSSDLVNSVGSGAPQDNLLGATPVISEKKQEDKEKDKEKKPKEDNKEIKKRKEQEEKQAKKEAEDKRKQEQRKQEIDKRVAEEKRKKEEEKARKELEKHKKEAEEKRLRELEEKRRLKEQRKAEEELKKKQEDTKKQEEEKSRREQKEREELARKQAEAIKQQELISRSLKPAPWCQSNSSLGLSLTEIQKAEKERKAQEAALQLQRQQILAEQQAQQNQEKSSGMSWAKKPLEPAKVKSLSEIQAEEQERLAKQAAEARLAAIQKEKETVVTNTGNIWNGQNLSWANNASSNNHWPGSAGGFWDENVPKPKLPISKSNSVSTLNSSARVQQQLYQQQLQQHQQLLQPLSQPQKKNKSKKEEPLARGSSNNNNNGNNEFTNWCYKTLSNITTVVDIPTFVSFLRDIESAFDVREYCKEYLGDSAATQQFASNFLEKRRSFKPKSHSHKDDMCQPAPAITPSQHNTNEFQEVKGKNKKNKKSKMYKVDARILGFNVTSAQDRINVGDRDYGDNS